MRQLGFASAMALSVLVCVGTQIHAQEVTAGIFGVIQDSTGAVIPGAAVRLRNMGTGRSAQTLSDESGNFSVTLLPIGTYEVTAEAKGFKKFTIGDVTLRVNENRRLVFTMEVGQLSDQVTVEAAAVAVDVATGTTSQLLDGHDMVRLPSRGRYVQPFALLMPGVVSTTPYDRRNNNSSVNGVRPTHNAWLIDGGYNIDTGGNWGSPLAPNIETVAEFRAIRGNYSAEFGTGGGSQFNVITKGGTNDLHGSLYAFHRNDKLNARNFFSPTRDPFIGNDFGGSVGGPVYIPKVYNGKNKTFFFVLIGFIKERRQQRFTQLLPTPAYRSGDFSALGRPIYDPASGLPFPNNIIPSARIDANAIGYAKMYPSPNFLDSAGRNWTALQGRLDNTDEKNFRVDHNINDNYRLMFRYTPEYRLSRYKEGPGFDIFTREDRTPARNMAANFSASLRPNLINDFNWVRSHNRIMYFPGDVSPAKWGINVQQLFPDNDQTYPLSSLNLSKVPDRVPTISSIVGYAALNNTAPWSNYQTIYEFKDNLTWIKRAHTIKTGFSYSYEIKFEPTNTNVFGDFNFDGRATGPQGGVGDAFADLLLGRASAYSETNTVAFNDNRRNAFEAYVDDSWKVSRRLTLNFGLRYSYFPPAHEPDNRFRVFIPTLYDPAKAVTVDSAGHVLRGAGDRYNGLVDPTNYWQTSKANFAPRFSFAYDLFGDGKTALRGGFGLFYSREILGAFILMSGNPPFSELLQVTNTALSNPGGGTARNYDLPITLGSIDMHQLTPYTEQWNFNIQRSLSNTMVLEVGYSGSRGIHLMRTQDLNQPAANAGIARGTLNADQLRPYKGWSVINHREQSYDSNYHGLQVGLNRSFSHGIMAQVAYTFSKAIDNADFTAGIYGYYPNTRDAGGERARASFDSTHNFVASYVWDLPFFKGSKGVAGKVLSGWQYSGVASIRTGLPISPELGRDIAGTGNSARQRPFAIASPVLPRDQRNINQWFNAAAYRPIVDSDYGTFSPVGRNVLSGPGWNQFDMSFAKIIRIKEGRQIEIRADGFNIFNHTQFATIGTSFFTPSQFGKVTATRDPRSFMVGARIQF
jgi:hypothetical protein